MKTKTKKRNAPERMDHGFSVFNLHINEAGSRADAEFIAQYGQKVFDKHIKPHHDEGIMSIFDTRMTRSPYKMAWVTLVTAFVNKGQHRYRPGYLRVGWLRKQMEEPCKHDKPAGDCRYCATKVLESIKFRMR
jgi:hypothetical protein